MLHCRLKRISLDVKQLVKDIQQPAWAFFIIIFWLIIQVSVPVPLMSGFALLIFMLLCLGASVPKPAVIGGSCEDNRHVGRSVCVSVIDSFFYFLFLLPIHCISNHLESDCVSGLGSWISFSSRPHFFVRPSFRRALMFFCLFVCFWYICFLSDHVFLLCVQEFTVSEYRNAHLQDQQQRRRPSLLSEFHPGTERSHTRMHSTLHDPM